MDQEPMNNVFCHALSYCFELQEMDITGCSMVDDNGIIQLMKGDIKDQYGKVV